MGLFARSILPRLSRGRCFTRSKQGGYIRGAMFSAIFGSKKFSPADLFRAGEQGFHFEAYDPTALVQRRNLLTYSGYQAGGVSGTVGSGAVAPTNWTFISSGGTVTYSASARYPGDQQIQFVATTSTDRPAIGQSYNVVAGQTYTQSFYVEAIAGGAPKLYEICTPGAMPAGATEVFRVNGVVTTDITTVVNVGDFVEHTIVIGSTGGSMQVRIGWGAVAMARTGGITLSPCQFEVGARASAYQKVTDWNTEYIAAVGAANIFMWQDTAETLAVYGIEQPIGKWKDKSGRGNHATQSTTTKRPILSARYNLLTGSDVLATQSVSTAATSYKFTFTGSGSVTLSGTATGTYTAGTYTITPTAGTVTVTVTGTVTKADLRTADDAAKNIPAYQAVRSSTDYDYAGFPFYPRFDGIDDHFVLPTMDLTAFDKVTVWAGVSKQSDASVAILVELSASTSTNNGTFYVAAPNTSAAPQYAFLPKGTISTAAVSPPNYAAPVSTLLTGLGDLSANPSAYLRLNGTAVVNNAAAAGGGALGNYPMYIGARAGTGLFFTGRVHSITVRASTTPTSEAFITKMNRYAANLMALPI